MQLSKIRIKNYRLLVDAELEIDTNTTLIVGRNNTAKTSCFKCICNVLGNSQFSFNDYPLSKRQQLYSSFDSFMLNNSNFEQLTKSIDPISVDFVVDYSQDGADDNLCALSPFIIDVDPNTTTAMIRAEYNLKFDEKRIRKILDPFYYENGNYSQSDDRNRAIVNNFNKLFEMKIYAINPKHPEEKQIKKQEELAELFPFQIIQAERRLGEDGSKNESLSSLINDFFTMNEDDLDPNVSNKVKELKKAIADANKKVQQSTDNILSELVSKAVGFGYPNGEELQLGVTTNLSIDEQVKNQSLLSYTTRMNKECLPSNYNGLGYNNLIKMEFILAAFAKKIEKIKNNCIPLLFIEEPESHMHPQMQHNFAQYLEDFLKKISSVTLQTLLTSHSAQIANTIDFSKIRYAQKTNNGVIYKNLKAFSLEKESNIDFIQKYLTLTKCDLFFADKAILVEGASERLLLPDMIEKCKNNGDFKSQKFQLQDQYYSLIEIGGAYAYKFIPFIDFLGIPCLIITDLDSVAKRANSSGTQSYKSVTVSFGETTSNETIKYWVRKNKNCQGDQNTKISLQEINNMTTDDKTHDKCHIEFQTKENGLCGRSLEESIRNVNRNLFNLENDITEDDLKFTEKSKTEFALNLIYKKSNYAIPSYIKNGLIWLNNQKVLE